MFISRLIPRPAGYRIIPLAVQSRPKTTFGPIWKSPQTIRMLSSRTPRIVEVLENLNDLERQHGPSMSCDLLPTLAGDRLICLVEYDELTVPTKALLNGLRDFQSLDQLIQDHRGAQQPVFQVDIMADISYCSSH